MRFEANAIINLPPGYELTLNDVKYTIEKQIGDGGSSIVYSAKSDEEPFLIKELCPKEIRSCIERNPDMSFSIPPVYRELMDEYAERAKYEHQILKELRIDKGKGKGEAGSRDSIDTWFKRYLSPVRASNGALYTVIAADSGDTLEDMMSEAYKPCNFKSFIEICECILSLLEALEPMHKKGYLHLDIAPDNVHFLKQKIKDHRIANMIDFNSAYKYIRETPEEKNRRFSQKKGYSAPELETLSGTTDIKALDLKPATDLYSVAFIFFELLTGRWPVSQDKTAFSRNKDIVSEYFGGMSSLIARKATQLLKKGLGRVSTSRFQSVHDMYVAVDELIELSKEITPTNKRKQQYPNFVGRKPQLQEIENILENANYVIVEGIGGIGKSELAKNYAWEKRAQYDIVQFITYEKSLMNTIALSLKFRNFDHTKYQNIYGEEEIIQRIFEDKMTFLQSYDEKMLIVVDNYNELDDDYFYDFVSGNYKVIFTSRIEHDVNSIVLSKMNDDDIIELFRKYYNPCRLADKDISTITEIIQLVLGHTMAVMLIAAAMKVHEVTPDDMLRKLQASLDPRLMQKISIKKEEIDVGHADRKQAMYLHIQALFDMEEIHANESYSFFMTNMAIMPHKGMAYKGMSKEEFCHWALDKRYSYDVCNYGIIEYTKADCSAIDELIRLRWIEYDSETNSISLHPVVSEVANTILEPDSEKCGNLVDGFLEYAAVDEAFDFFQNSEYLNLIELAGKRISDKSGLTFGLYATIAGVHFALAQYEEALDYAHKAKEMSDYITTYNPICLITVLQLIVGIFSKQCKFDEAKQVSAVLKEVLDKHSIS